MRPDVITTHQVPFLTSLFGSVYNIYAYKMVLIQVNVANTDGKYVHKIECLFAKISRTCSINNRVIKGSLLLRYTFKIVRPKVANIQILFARITTAGCMQYL